MQQHTTNLIFFFFLLLGYGAAGQPVLVKDIVAGSGSGVGNIGREMQVLGGRIFFWANDGSMGDELWMSDGTAAGTVLLKDINPGTASSGPGKMMTVFKNQVYFDATTPSAGTELWSTDGTETGTKMLIDACTGTCSGAKFGSFPPEFVELNGNLILGLGLGGSTAKLCTTDGTAANTKVLNDITLPGNMFRFKDKVFFTVNSFSNILRVTDGTVAGTLPFKSYGDRPVSMIASDSLFFFRVADTGADLHRSNGTTTGTFLLRKANSDGNLNTARNTAVVNGKLLFESVVSGSGAELWVSDGSVSGTVLLKEFIPGFGGAGLYFLGKLGEKLIFGAYSDLVGNEELWISDGTVNGTKLLKEIVPGSTGSAPRNAKIVLDKMLFTAVNANNELELWKTDGTESGTTLVLNLTASTGIKATGPSVQSGNNLFFMATTDAAGSELWKLDITPPVASIAAAKDTACTETPVDLMATPSLGSNLSYTWDFGAGATPQTAQGAGPQSVKYAAVGTKTVRLIVSNGIASDTTFQNITVISKPTSSFTFVKTNLSFAFTNTSTGFISLLWNFGDGNTSTETFPTHAYATAGTYTVTLTAINACGSTTSTKTVMPTVGTRDLITGQKLSISPNPSQGLFQVKGSTTQGGQVGIRICDMQGRTLRTEQRRLPAGAFDFLLDASGLPANVYQLILQTDAGILTERISIMP
jgi:ELWxxDGT repeat protein